MNAAPTPITLPAIAELAQRDQWVAWKYVKRGDKLDKPPFNVRTRSRASHSNPDHWHSYAEAHAAKGYTGIGFVFSADDPYTGIDYDGCRNPETGAIADWAHTWIAQLNSYAEISPSGTGIKQIVRGTIPHALKWSLGDHTGIEVYTTQRYFCTTEQHLAGTPTAIHAAQPVLDQLVHALQPAPAPTPAPKPAPALRVSPGEAGAARLSLDDARRRFNAEHSLDDLLTRYGATATKDGYTCCCGVAHTHATTLYISRQGKLFSYSPQCKLYTRYGWDAFGLFVKVEYNDTIADALRAINPPPAAHQCHPEPPHSVETVEYTISPDAQARRAADAARKRTARRSDATQIRADIEARASGDTTLTEDAHLILLTLLDAAQERICTRWSVARMAEVLTPAVNPKKPGTYKRRVYTALAQLRDAGYITNEAQHGKTTWRTFVRVQSAPDEADVPTDAKRTPLADAFASESEHDHDSHAESGACEPPPVPPAPPCVASSPARVAPQATQTCELRIVRADGRYHVADQHGAIHGTHASEDAAYAQIAALYGALDDAAVALEAGASYHPEEDCSRLDLAARTPLPLLPYEQPDDARKVGVYAPMGWTPRDQDDADGCAVAAQPQLDGAPVASAPLRTTLRKSTAYARKLAAMSDRDFAGELRRITNAALSQKFAGAGWVKRCQAAIAREKQRRGVAAAPPARDPAAGRSQAPRARRMRQAEMNERGCVQASLFADGLAPPARSVAAMQAVAR